MGLCTASARLQRVPAKVKTATKIYPNASAHLQRVPTTVRTTTKIYNK